MYGKIILGITIFLLLSSFSNGQITCKFVGSGDWSDPNNWFNGLVPSSPLSNSDSIIITSGSQASLNVNFLNRGVILIESGASLDLQSHISLTNEKLLINNGTFIKNGGDLVNELTVSGVGTFVGNYQFPPSSVIKPGNDTTGILTFDGNLTTSGSVYFDITGPGSINEGTPGDDYDVLVVSDTLSINCLVFINFRDSIPEVGEEYCIFDYQNRVGFFMFFNVLPEGIFVQLDYNTGCIIVLSQILPVEFLSFEVTKIGTTSHLKWITAAEINNMGFEIQRSASGIKWDNIGFVEAKGEGFIYHFVDKNPLIGSSFYRLKQIDHSGNFSHSYIIAVTHTNIDKDFVLFPNPATSEIRIIYDSNELDSWEIEIMDISGRLFKKIPLGNDKILSVEDLQPGKYFMKLNSNNQLVKVFRFLKI